MDLSRKSPFDHASLSNKKSRDFEKELVEIDKKFNEARGAKLKYQLGERDTIKDNMEFETDANIIEPFEAYVKQQRDKF